MKYLDYDGLSYLWQVITNRLSTKVDKVDGKGLSSNDYTATEKAKLANIEAGAEVNVNADWNASTGDSAILNKPTIPSKTSDLTNDSNYVSDSSYVHTDNNYTSTEKTKLSGIASNAQVNVIETVKVNGSALTPTSKAVDITVPINTSDLTNDSNFVSDASYVHTDVNFTSTLKSKLDGITSNATRNIIDSSMSDSSTNAVQNAVVKSYIDNAVGALTGIDFQIVQSLPATGTKGVIYLIAHSHGTGDSYDEYIYVNNTFEKIGNTDIDLSGYVQTTDLVAITNAEIDTIVAS